MDPRYWPSVRSRHAAFLDKMKFERLTYLFVYRSDGRFQRNDRRSVFALFISSRPGEAVDIDNTIEPLALANDRKPCLQILTENIARRGQLFGQRGYAYSAAATNARRSGYSSHSRLSSVRPPLFGRAPPHCLKKNATPCPTHWSLMLRTQFASIARAPGPLSPPAITQSMPARSSRPRCPRSGSRERNRIDAGAARRCAMRDFAARPRLKLHTRYAPVPFQPGSGA